MTNPNPKTPQILDDEYRQLVHAAKLYYQHDFIQSEIAKRMGVSRIKVHRMLRAAKEAGIVKISIDDGGSGYVDLENQLMVAYDLRDAVVVQSEEKQKELYLSLASGAVSWLFPRMKADLRVGLGLGRTISHLPQVWNHTGQVDCVFTEVVGAASDYSQGFAPYNITSKLADLTGGRAEFFYAPTYVSNPELKKSLIEEPSIRQALENARSCEIVLQSVGLVDDSALLYMHDFITKEDLVKLRNKGAIGDAVGHYFDKKGEPVSAFTSSHVIGIDLEDLRKIPWSVCIAGGSDKAPVITAALKGKLFNVLITDAKTAQMMMDLQ